MPTIWCPYHRRRESFIPPVMQPRNNLLVCYPCGYVDGVDDKTPSPVDEVAELREEIAKLKERQRYIPRPPVKQPSRPAEPPPSKGLADRYQKEA